MTERYNPWTVVHVLFAHLSEMGLHPVLGEAGDPSVPATELLLALGIQPGEPANGDGHVAEQVREDLATLRSQYDSIHGSPESRRP